MTRALLAAIVAALTLPQTASAVSEWAALPNSPSAGGRHEDVWFVDQLTGWVVNSAGEIWHTTDGGNSWQSQGAFLGLLRSVTFTSPLRGWIGTLFAEQTPMYETTNGGTTWTVVTNFPEPYGICGLWAASDDVLYGVGRYYMPATLFKSTDAGETWVGFDLSQHARTLVDCYFPTPNFGFAVGSVGHFPDSSRAVVLRTTNGGASWQTRHTSSRMGEWGWKISFPSPAVGYVSVERETGPMVFLKSTNGGDTWTEKPCPNSNEQGIGFLAENVGWLGGWGSPSYSTTDGGESWQSFGVLHNLNRIRFVGGGVAYAVGAKVYRYGPGPTSAPLTLASAEPMLSTSRPNPFTTTASIELTLPEDASARLEIFDASGRRIRTILDDRLTAGTHRAIWNGRDAAGASAPPGVYFWRLETDRAMSSRKTLLLR